MTCYTAEFTGNLLPSSEIKEMVWLEYKDLYDNGLIAMSSV